MQEQEKKVAVEETVDTEYMLEPVPMNKRRSTYSQIMVWVGFGYCATDCLSEVHLPDMAGRRA